MKKYLIIILAIIFVMSAGIVTAKYLKPKKTPTISDSLTPTPTLPAPTETPSLPSPSATPTPQPSPTEVTKVSTQLIEPIAEFRLRITKKLFGTKVTPDNSPVQPEKFSGYHTGVDVEYTDKPGEEIPVKSVSDGTVVTSRTASGYGGVVAIQHTIGDKKIVAVYGHLDPQSMVKNGTSVKAGDKIGILGEGGTSETDGERKHLHLSFAKGTGVNIKGYVQSESELSGWYNPLSFF
jgi:murein DD-endopeptidase MepM/ murein hydrolase activator NlpD